MLPLVFLTALAVGGATMLGALGGYCFRGAADRAGGQTVMAFAAGMMLSAAVAGLILPSLAGGGPWAFPVTAAGILSGAAFLLLLERLAARMQRLSGLEGGASPRTRRVLLFVAAMAIHNFPEGLAAGVGFGTEDVPRALAIAGGIALQNLPEGMVLIAPMLQAGIPPRRTLALAVSTGAVEIVGTLLGYGTVSLSAAALPFLLAFAGGAMLYLICDDMIPACRGSKSLCALLTGFCFMLAMDHYLG
jgi:ZIP family zinc transporter